MHFGYFGLMGYRERGTPPERVFREHIEQVRHADALGFEIAWFAEHHFSNYCICPSPLMMVARCAGETRSIKLGPAVVVTPLYDPARLIAEIGMADCLTSGRLVLGVGSGYQPYEFERFGKDPAEARPMLEEFPDMFGETGTVYILPSRSRAAEPPDGDTFFALSTRPSWMPPPSLLKNAIIYPILIATQSFHGGPCHGRRHHPQPLRGGTSRPESPRGAAQSQHGSGNACHSGGRRAS